MQITWLPAALCTDEAMDTLEGAQWRKSPGDFGIGGRYPVKEVFAAAAATWQGESPLTSSCTAPASRHFGVQLTCNMMWRALCVPAQYRLSKTVKQNGT